MVPVGLRAGTRSAARAAVSDVGGRAAVVVDVESSVRRGALTSTASDTIVAGARTALAERLPFVAFLGSSGADITEGVAALHGWGAAARALADCSGTVPIVINVTGPAVSGPALLVGLADLVVMTDASYAFVSGPAMVAEFTGVQVGNDELGGAAAHARHSGVASIVVDDVAACRDATASLLAYLPPNNDAEPPLWDSDDPVDRPTAEAAAVLPASASGTYDIRAVMGVVVDDGELLEVRERFATNIVTAFATIGGRPIGLVGNQPLSIAGTLDIQASQKAARFVAFCDAFNLPIVTFVDTPGFYPGKDLEWRGMIRHGAQLAFAYARASVPRVGVVLRKSFGGAYIVMDSKTMGNDIFLAWPTAEIAVMGARQAAEILQRRTSAEERAAFEADYTGRLLNPYIAAERGYIDAVIAPADTRREIARALSVLDSKREHFQPRKHDNSPL